MDTPEQLPLVQPLFSHQTAAWVRISQYPHLKLDGVTGFPAVKTYAPFSNMKRQTKSTQVIEPKVRTIIFGHGRGWCYTCET